jgi:hypothetical protein
VQLPHVLLYAAHLSPESTPPELEPELLDPEEDPELELALDPDPELDPELEPELDPELDPEPELDPDDDPELDPDPPSATHWPPTHAVVPVHGNPHDPQLASSDVRSTHAPLQGDRPAQALLLPSPASSPPPSPVTPLLAAPDEEDDEEEEDEEEEEEEPEEPDPVASAPPASTTGPAASSPNPPVVSVVAPVAHATPAAIVTTAHAPKARIPRVAIPSSFARRGARRASREPLGEWREDNSPPRAAAQSPAVPASPPPAGAPYPSVARVHGPPSQ